MSLIVLAFIIGVVAGLRAMTAPAAISWAARLGRLHLEDTWLAFLGFAWTPWILSIAALGELVNDKLPGTASRKTPPQFIARILSGSLCGAAIGASLGSLVTGLLAGALGSVAGTLGGAEARSRLVKVTGGKDWPIAVLEDAVAVVTAFLVARWVV
jgi:uncharacterized membrane protein